MEQNEFGELLSSYQAKSKLQSRGGSIDDSQMSNNGFDKIIKQQFVMSTSFFNDYTVQIDFELLHDDIQLILSNYILYSLFFIQKKNIFFHPKKNVYSFFGFSVY